MEPADVAPDGSPFVSAKNKKKPKKRKFQKKKKKKKISFLPAGWVITGHSAPNWWETFCRPPADGTISDDPIGRCRTLFRPPK